MRRRRNATWYSNTSQTRGSKLAKFSNSRFLSLFFTSKLAVPLCSTQIRDSGYFLSPKNREFGGITVLLWTLEIPILDSSQSFKQCFKDSFWIKQSLEFLKISKAATTLLALATGKQITYGTLTKWAKNLTNLILCTVPHCVAGGSICQKILACMQPETFQETLLILSLAFF